MLKRKRTASDAGLNITKSSPNKRRKKFKPPKVINKAKWNSASSPVRNRKITVQSKKWRCIECDTSNLESYVFCQTCAAYPPKLHSPKASKSSKPSSPLFDTKFNKGANENNNKMP